MNLQNQLYYTILECNAIEAVTHELPLEQIIMAIDATLIEGSYKTCGNRLSFYLKDEEVLLFSYDLKKPFSQQSDWFYERLLDLLK